MTMTSRQRGQGLVEFALTIPLFILMLLGLVDLGRAVYAYTTISNAAREGARLAIVNQTQAGGTYIAQAEAANSATSLGIAAASVTISFRTPDLSGSCANRTIGCVAQVTVPYSFTAITPIVGNIVGTINMSSTVRIPIERTLP